MSIFSLGRKPRRFHHVPIFYDERADRLKAMEQKARKKVEQEGAEPYSADNIRGAFSRETTHLRRHQERAGGWTANIGMLAIIILVLLVVWFLLLK